MEKILTLWNFLNYLSSELDKSSADVAAEGAILNEMLEIVAKRAALRPTETVDQQQQNENDDSDVSLKYKTLNCSLFILFLLSILFACVLFLYNFFFFTLIDDK